MDVDSNSSRYFLGRQDPDDGVYILTNRPFDTAGMASESAPRRGMLVYESDDGLSFRVVAQTTGIGVTYPFYCINRMLTPGELRRRALEESGTYEG